MATPVLKIKESLEENEIVEIQESAAQVPKEARKVARKSTKPPRNPQQESPESREENPGGNDSKEESESALERREPRKVARKSTRPPRNPDRGAQEHEEVAEMEEKAKIEGPRVAEIRKAEEDIEVLEVKTSIDPAKNESEFETVNRESLEETQLGESVDEEIKSEMKENLDTISNDVEVVDISDADEKVEKEERFGTPWIPSKTSGSTTRFKITVFYH